MNQFVISARLRGAALALTSVALAALAGCAPMPKYHLPPAPQPVKPAPPPVEAHPLIEPQLQEQTIPAPKPQVQAPPPSSPAVLALVTRAERQQRMGDLGGSEATLERAVQIEPHNARLWLDFARLRLSQQQPAQAEQFALRAVQYAQTGSMLRQAWMMVAQARQAQGNRAGAAEARRKAGAPGSGQGQ